MKNVFYNLSLSYCKNENVIALLWQGIEANYTSAGRFYHNLEHIQNLFTELQAVKNSISDWDASLFALFYHDVCYDILQKDNEEQSAILAVMDLSKLGFSKNLIDKVEAMIIATQSHTATGDVDTDLFTDADIAILGKEKDVYRNYASQIRQEYAFYDDVTYRQGRIQLLRHFLQAEFIYNTIFFREKYELQARENMEKELLSLSC